MVHMILIIERSEILLKPFIIAILSINVLIIGFFIYIVLDETVSVWVLKRILHAASISRNKKHLENKFYARSLFGY